MTSPGTCQLDDDRTSSPVTGWTRRHWVASADVLLAGARSFSSPSYARVRFPGRAPDDVDELEGFARTFLLAALRLADDPDAEGGGLLARQVEALTCGTTPGHPEAWPAIRDHDQTLVEAAAVAVGLHWSRAALWPALPPTVRERVLAWFAGARGRWCADNNHVLFGATLEAFAGSVGAPYDAGAVETALARVDDLYVGDGWYSDGVGRRFDHYNAWTFHLYPLLVAAMLGDEALPGATELYRARLRSFLSGYQHLIDASGSPVLQGRSLTYRWGVLAPFWLAAQHGCSPLTPGRTRRLASGVLSHFVQAGVGADGRLGLGWHGPTASVLQPYNAPGSPYWASKGFLGLLMPADHPVWTATEEPLALERGDVVTPLAAPAWLAVGTRVDGVVRVLNHGSDGHPQHDVRWYRRLAFSSRTAPCEVDGVRDNVVDVLSGEAPARHRGLRGGAVGPRRGSSAHVLDCGGRDVTVEVAAAVDGALELRVARVRGAVGLPVRVSGHAVAGDAPPGADVGPGSVATVAGSGLSSTLGVVDVSSGVVRPGVAAGAADHPFGGHVAVPWALVSSTAGDELRLAWFSRLTGVTDPPEVGEIAVRWLEGGAELCVGGRVHRLRWTRHRGWAGDAVGQGVLRLGAPDPDLEQLAHGS